MPDAAAHQNVVRHGTLLVFSSRNSNLHRAVREVAAEINYGRGGLGLVHVEGARVWAIGRENILARTTRTLGTLVSSGVPILEALNITRDTAGNAMFERLYGKVSESIREGESIAKPLKEHSTPPFNGITALFWFCFCAGPIGLLLYLGKMKRARGSTTWWSTWWTSAKRRANWTRCFTRWPTPTTRSGGANRKPR